MKQRITLVDDDRNILASVSLALEAEGFAVSAFHEPEAALESILSDPPDLAVLDVKMPRMDGFELLQQIRARSALPVVFLTSKDEEEDQFLGLRLGADDYITKPFSQKLLIERLRVILRREQMRKTAPAPENVSLLRRGALTLDEDRHLCSWRGVPVDLTVTEFFMVRALAQRPGHVKSREQIMNAAYGPGTYVDDRTVDSHVKRIRKKFKAADADFDQIETVYGAGYRFKDADHAE